MTELVTCQSFKTYSSCCHCLFCANPLYVFSFEGPVTLMKVDEVAKKKKKPNIVVILADDVGMHDVSGYWNDCCNVVDMPNLRSLQEKGVTFYDAHSTPLCAPSRYMILSGNWPHRGMRPDGTWSLLEDGKNQFYGKQKSIAHMLKVNGGYKTAMMGKWHLGGGVPGKFDSSHLLSCCDLDWTKPMKDGPNDIGFDETYFTPEGIQRAPYSFFRDGYLTTKVSDIKYWKKGQHQTKTGNFSIGASGEVCTLPV